MSPRQRRLHSDFEKLKYEFLNHPLITIEYDLEENFIPERYFVYYKDLKGIKLTQDSTPENRKIEVISNHKIEIYLHIDYPRLKPLSYIHSKIFHPNFRMASPHDICIGDFWASGETLADIIYQIGDMIQYQNYNITSPLNGIAAKWARENKHLLPIDNKVLRKSEPTVILKDPFSDKDQNNIDDNRIEISF